MIFVCLALVALSFGLFGFLLHAFYFSKDDLIDSLGERNQELEQNLALREKLNEDAREEIAKTRLLVRSLERQLERRDQQMHALKSMASQQERDIRTLQKTATEMGLNFSGPDIRQGAAFGETAVEPPGAGPAAEIKKQKIPLWKDRLDNILNVLDKIEKETDKEI